MFIAIKSLKGLLKAEYDNNDEYGILRLQLTCHDCVCYAHAHSCLYHTNTHTNVTVQGLFITEYTP